MNLNELRQQLRDKAQHEQNHIALHLFAENDVLREMIEEMAKALEDKLDNGSED